LSIAGLRPFFPLGQIVVPAARIVNRILSRPSSGVPEVDSPRFSLCAEQDHHGPADELVIENKNSLFCAAGISLL